MMLNLQSVRVFAVVAEQRNFTRAAALLYISQPAVSKTIQELERHIGLTLIERGARSLVLTEAGERLYQQAHVILVAERAAEEELAALRGVTAGTLRIGASTTIATYLLPPLVGAFHHQVPAIEVAVTSANTQEIADLLVDYRLDVALVEGPVTHEQIEVRPWRTDELVVIAALHHPLAAAAGIAVAALADQLVIVREPGSGTRDVAEQALRGVGVTPRRTLELGSTEAIKQAVAAGLGVALVSRATILDQLALGKLVVVAVDDFCVTRQLNRLLRAGRVSSPVVTAFEPFLNAPEHP